MIEAFTSMIAPHICLSCGLEGTLLCTNCSAGLIPYAPRCYKCARLRDQGQLCVPCRRNSSLASLQAAVLYQGTAKELVRVMKYERAKAAAKTIAELMCAYISLPATGVLVPIPTATSRARIRGYDQATLISKELSKLSGLPCVLLLQRIGQQRQVGQTRAKRLVQLQDAFHAKALGEHKNIILVDDVTTTGATFEAAAACLKANGARRIEAIAFAAAADR